MHDLLRAYAAELAAAEDGGQEQQAALTRLFDYYLAAAASAMDVLVPAERHHRPRPRPLRHAGPAVADPAAGARPGSTPNGPPWSPSRAHRRRTAGRATPPGWPPSCTATSRPAATTPTRSPCTAGRTRPPACSGDRAAEAMALTNLGIISWRQGRYQQAADYHQQALTRIGRDRRPAEARPLRSPTSAPSTNDRAATSSRALPPAGPGRLSAASATGPAKRAHWATWAPSPGGRASTSRPSTGISGRWRCSGRSATRPARPARCPTSGSPTSGWAATRRPSAATSAHWPCSGRPATGRARSRRATAWPKSCSPPACRTRPAWPPPPR